MRPIPLNKINAFEAAARHLSFSRAAQELNVQQPAVSRQISTLETDLGIPLFLRTKPRLTLTKDGQALFESVSKGFDAIRSGLDTLRTQSQNETIVVSASIGFTSLYLLPRLAEFQAAYPSINLQIITRDQNADFDVRTCDAIILFGKEGLTGAKSELVFDEHMIAVCRPDLLNGKTILDRSDLAQQKLLHLSSDEHSRDWQRYFEGAGIDPLKPPLHDRYLSYMVYLRAIQNGLGIGIGWRPMLDEYLASGALVLACDHVPSSERGYYCSVTTAGAKKAGAQLFLDWIARVECQD